MNHLVAEAKRLKRVGKEKQLITHVFVTTDLYCVLELTVPPTVNTYYTVSRGRKILSQDGRAYKKALSYLNVEKLQAKEISIVVELYARDKRRRDLDNILKPLLDGLQGAGLYDDDSQISNIRVTRREQDKRHIVKVYVEKYDSEML